MRTKILPWAGSRSLEMEPQIQGRLAVEPHALRHRAGIAVDGLDLVGAGGKAGREGEAAVGLEPKVPL